MSRTLGNIAADSLQLSLNYADRLLVGVEAKDFARFARPGGQLVKSNHPAFIYGHLSLYGQRIVAQCGGDASSLAPPESFTAAFSRDAACEDDGEGKKYPPMAEITEWFFKGYRAGLTALREVNDDRLQTPNDLGGRSAELFPTTGSMLAFYSGGHLMMHLGQMSAWRRMMGLGEA